MKHEHKVLIGMGIGIASVLVTGLVVLGIWWFRETVSRTKVAASEGTTFAVGHDADACVDEALRRLFGPGLADEACMRVFLKNCLADAPRSASFCADVPAPGDIVKGVFFGMRLCARKGFAADERCSRSLAEELPEACATPVKSPPRAP